MIFTLSWCKGIGQKKVFILVDSGLGSVNFIMSFSISTKHYTHHRTQRSKIRVVKVNLPKKPSENDRLILKKKIWVLPVDTPLQYFGNKFIDDGFDIDKGTKYSFEGESDYDENTFGHKLGSTHSKETPSGTKNESKKFLIHQV